MFNLFVNNIFYLKSNNKDNNKLLILVALIEKPIYLYRILEFIYFLQLI
jgi:hypothetical protein